VTRRRTLAIGLDGYEPSIAEGLMAEGRMPRLADLRDRSARFALDHGAARRTGLAWEHVALGRSPEAYGRFAAVHFDPEDYSVVQRGTAYPPVLAGVDLRAVIFDAPYFDLTRAPNCRGLVHWGAHDAGVAARCVPDSLAQEIESRFGAYPATPWIYGFVWPDAERARLMADALVRAVDARTEVSHWLLAERLPEWDLALVVASEPHSALEALWHGIDPGHPLHGLPSAGAARDGVLGVYEAVDRLVGELGRAFPDVQLVVFSMHGMGPNRSDLQSMLLLPELLHRQRFGSPCFVPRSDWVTSDGVPRLGADERWSTAILACLSGVEDGPGERLRHRARRALARLGSRARSREPAGQRLAWMPAAHYRRFWSGMEAFALPSFYDGRVRINLAGRERAGRVAARDYAAECDRVADLVSECRDARSGEPVVSRIERPVHGDPLRAGPTAADLIFTWRGAPNAFQHPRLGLIGPAPYRRTGGHTGGLGLAYLSSPHVSPGEYGVRSAFDVVPTLLALCGAEAPEGISGESLLPLCGGR
jgi:predicted AlkP superfamily phosphohydrolase/phosphomutase